MMYESEEPYVKNYKRFVALFGCPDMERDVLLLPKNIQELHIVSSDCRRVILLDRDVRENLEKLHINHCPKIKYIIGPEADIRYSFSRLQTINIRCCSELEEITAVSSLELRYTLAPAPSYFSHLTSLSISYCSKMKRLLNHGMLPHFSNLQAIVIYNCKNMEEVTNTYSEHTGNLCTVTPLPSLKTLKLVGLSELRSIGSVALACPIETIKVVECPKIKKIPLQMQRLPNGVPTPPSSLKEIIISAVEKERWEALEWESPEVKAALQPYVRLTGLWEPV